MVDTSTLISRLQSSESGEKPKEIIKMDVTPYNESTEIDVNNLTNVKKEQNTTDVKPVIEDNSRCTFKTEKKDMAMEVSDLGSDHCATESDIVAKIPVKVVTTSEAVVSIPDPAVSQYMYRPQYTPIVPPYPPYNYQQPPADIKENRISPSNLNKQIHPSIVGPANKDKLESPIHSVKERDNFR